MIRSLLLITTLMLAILIGYGNYNIITLIFIISSILFPPIIFKYKEYPERSIYLFLILWITFPKFIRYLPIIGTYDLPGINYFDILQAIFSFHIIFLLIRNGYKKITDFGLPLKIKKLTIFYFITIFIVSVLGLLRYYLFIPTISRIEFGNYIELLFTPFVGIIFFLGLFAFIKKFNQVEKILYVFVLAGILLLFEHLILVQLNLFDALKIYAYAADQVRFNSLIYGSYDIKGIFCVLSSLSILYLSFKKRKYYLIILALLMIIPISETYQRTPYIGYFLGLITFFIIYIRRKKQFTRFVFLILLLLTTSFLIFNQQLISNNFNNFLTGNQMVRQEVNENQSLYDRIGLWYRAADIFIYSFPFGIGEGMYEVYALQGSVPKYMYPFLPHRSKDSYRAINTEKATKVHNVYIQFISEYNVLGLLGLWFFVLQILRHIRNKKFDESDHISNIYKSTVVSMIIALAVMNMFDSVIRLYFIYGMLFFFTYIFSKSKSELNV